MEMASCEHPFLHRIIIWLRSSLLSVILLFQQFIASSLCGHDESAATSKEVLIINAHLSKFDQDSANIDEASTWFLRNFHVEQKQNWDCGVACLLYVFQWLLCDNPNSDEYALLNDTKQEELRNWILKKLNTNSIWTADLVALLHGVLASNYHEHDATSCINDTQELLKIFSIHQVERMQNFSYLFCSKNLSVSQSYESFDYYKTSFGEDKMRLISFFDNQQHYFVCEMRRLSINSITYIVSSPETIAIILLDNSILLASVETSAYGLLEIKSMKSTDSYVGHYVVIKGISRDAATVADALGYDNTESFCFILANPGSKEPNQLVSPSLLKRSFESQGTDGDIIFIRKLLNQNLS